MKTNAKKIIALIMFAVMILTSSATAVFAAEVEPIEDEIIIEDYENCYRCSSSFTIDNSGIARVSSYYNGIDNVFTYAKATVKLQKKVFLFFWSDVEVNANSQWVDYCYDLNGAFYFSHQLDSTGTYRAVITVEIYGTTNEVDTFNDTIEYQYN